MIITVRIIIIIRIIPSILSITDYVRVLLVSVRVKSPLVPASPDSRRSQPSYRFMAL